MPVASGQCTEGGAGSRLLGVAVCLSCTVLVYMQPLQREIAIQSETEREGREWETETGMRALHFHSGARLDRLLCNSAHQNVSDRGK